VRYGTKRSHTRGSLLLLTCLAVTGLSAALGGCAPARASAGLSARQAGTPSVVSSPVRVAHTSLGSVGYRIVGSGPPLVMITGYSATMEDWDPTLVDALARHYRVIVFDNAGIGRTQQLPGPLTIDAMARQTSALIDTLRLSRPDVLGWSMGGTIAQALAVLDPSQVRRLVLCATFPGTGHVAIPTQSVQADLNGNPQQVAEVLFPANQASAYDAYIEAISGYPPAPAAPAAVSAAQGRAVSQWWAGDDSAGRRISTVSIPTLVAGGTADQVDPVANDHALARLIPGAKLVLYPDAAHAFLFQDATQFAAAVESFLKAANKA
jgi:pimeloyl-ACP methyl ester carboxylesterase